MSDALQQQLTEMFAALLATAQDASAFAKTQVPALVEEKIRLGRVEESGVYALEILAGILCVWCGLYFWKRSWAFTRDGGDFPTIVFNVVALFAGVVFFQPPHDFLLVWLAPRLYIVEWLRGLVKA